MRWFGRAPVTRPLMILMRCGSPGSARGTLVNSMIGAELVSEWLQPLRRIRAPRQDDRSKRRIIPFRHGESYRKRCMETDGSRCSSPCEYLTAQTFASASGGCGFFSYHFRVTNMFQGVVSGGG